MIIILWK